MKDKWDFLLSEFRRFGGIADNIYQKEGEYGRGIFPINSNLKTRILTPSKLLFKKDEIYLEDNKLRMSKDGNYNEEERNFFNFYQDNFSWHSGGKETTELFEKGLSLFSSNLKKLIKEFAMVDIDLRHKGSWDNVIKNQFLNSRAVKFRGTSVIAPIWDLVNHRVNSLNFIINKDGISTPNYPASNCEIRHSYGYMSPLKCFFSYGFFSEESIVFSFPLSINIEDLGISIFCKGSSLKDDSMKIVRTGNQIILDGLPIADANHPRLPHDYFNEIIKRIGDINLSKDLLTRIFEFNISMRKKILDESQLIENQVSNTLTKLMLYEINLISSRD
tara:strand:- start:185 stop:1180 length:996 start_codon:yes stop_codon:yes gene_type:complete